MLEVVIKKTIEKIKNRNLVFRQNIQTTNSTFFFFKLSISHINLFLTSFLKVLKFCFFFKIHRLPRRHY